MKKAKKIAIIFSIILLIGASAFAAVYYLTDVFKTPQEAFYSYVEKATTHDNSSSYQEMLEALKTSQTKSYKSESSIGIEVNSKEYTSAEEQAALNMLKNLKLNVNTNAKPSEKKSTSEISLNFGGFSAGNLKLVRDGDIFGLKSDLLDNKYIAVENKNLKDLFAKLGADTTNVPDKLESIDIYDLLYISPEDEFNLEKTYKDIFKNNIPAENFTKEENVTQKINGEDKNTTAYKLSLDEEDFINVMVKVLETVEEDDTLLNIITEKFNKLVESGVFDEIDVSSSYSLPSTSKTKKSKITSSISTDVLKQELKEIISQLKEEKQYASKSKVEIIVYAANNDIAKLELKANNEVQMAAEFYNQNDKKHIVFYAKQDSYEYNSYLDYYNYKAPKKSSELMKIIELEYKSTKGFNDRTLDASLIIYEDDEQVAKISYDITSKGKVGQGTNESNGKVTFEFDGIAISLLIDSKVEYTDDVSVDSINSQNANILNNMSQKEIENYFEGIVEGFEDTFSMFGLNNSIQYPNNYWIDDDDDYIDGSQETDDLDDETDSIDAEELEKQIQELNERLKELQESNS